MSPTPAAHPRAKGGVRQLPGGGRPRTGFISTTHHPPHISARTPTSPASCVNTGRCKGQAERARTAKGGECLEAAKGRVSDGEACVSFDADGRVILYDLY